MKLLTNEEYNNKMKKLGLVESQELGVFFRRHGFFNEFRWWR